MDVAPQVIHGVVGTRLQASRRHRLVPATGGASLLGKQRPRLFS